MGSSQHVRAVTGPLSVNTCFVKAVLWRELGHRRCPPLLPSSPLAFQIGRQQVWSALVSTRKELGGFFLACCQASFWVKSWLILFSDEVSVVIVVSAGALAPPEDMLRSCLAAAPSAQPPPSYIWSPCACSNTFLCSLPRIDKTMLASLKIK